MTDVRGGEAEARLPRPPGFLRRAMAEYPLAVDIFIVVWYLIGCLIGISMDSIAAAAPLDNTDPTTWFELPEYLAWPWWPIAALRIAAVAAALLYRRRYPLAGLVVVTISLFGEHGVLELATAVALLFMIYAVPVHRGVRAGWVGYGIALAGSIIDGLLNPTGEATIDGAGGEIDPGSIFLASGRTSWDPVEFLFLSAMTAAWYLVILMIGINLGNRRRYVEAIIDRANQLARERDQLARLAVAEERSRIAREMHDIVAHSVSVMIALSEGAARSAAVAPDAAADAMTRSAETGRTALAEMRRMLGALNDSSESAAELAPQPGVEDLPALLEGFRDAGVDASLDLRGDHTGDRGQDLAVYRVVQEALTNALRYAGSGSRATVSITREPDRTLVEVRDFGARPGVEVPRQSVGSGQGIAGLRERVRMFGGELEAGPALGGTGWVLRASLPVSTEASGQVADGRTAGGDAADERES